MSIKPVFQHDETDCGVCCVAMLLNHYGKTVSVRKIRAVAGTDTAGTSGKGIIKACEAFGLSCKVFTTPEKSISELPFPSIIHTKKQGLEHYVVLKKIKNGKVYFCDPALGNTRLTVTDFLELWSGIFFVTSPGLNFEKTNDEKNVLIKYFALLKPYKSSLIKILTSSFILTFLQIFVSFYFRFLIDEVLYSHIKSTLNLCSVCYLLVIVFQVLMNFCRSQIILYLGTKIDVTLVSDFFFHLLKLPMSFYNSRKSGEILSRLYDTTTIKNAVSSSSISVLIDSVMIVLGGVFLFKIGGKLLPVIIIPVILSAMVVFILKKSFSRKIKEQAIIQAEKNANFYECINGIATIKALSTEEASFERCEAIIVESGEKAISLGSLGNIQNSIQTLLNSLGTLAIYWLGSFLIFDGTITLGQLISFSILSSYFLGPLTRVLTMQAYWQEVIISSQRLSDILDIKEECENEENKEEVKSICGDIIFDDVSFSYGTRGLALNNINITIPQGKKVAFVGMSGSGKTTLLKLLMRFYDCNKGKITINNTNISDYKTSEYRQTIGYVPQECLLFSGTIFENLILGAENPSKEKVIEVARLTGCLDFINALPEKFKTIVGEHGATLSGGERQRLALARVLINPKDILILDEATSSLDSISEQRILKTIYNQSTDVTVIMVAHRLSTIKNCDLIYVFENGNIVEQGNHNELLRKNQKYAELWRMQNE